MENKNEKQCYVAPKIDVGSIYLGSNFFGSGAGPAKLDDLEMDGDIW